MKPFSEGIPGHEDKCGWRGLAQSYTWLASEGTLYWEPICRRRPGAFQESTQIWFRVSEPVEEVSRGLSTAVWSVHRLSLIPLGSCWILRQRSFNVREIKTEISYITSHPLFPWCAEKQCRDWDCVCSAGGGVLTATAGDLWLLSSCQSQLHSAGGLGALDHTHIPRDVEMPTQ